VFAGPKILWLSFTEQKGLQLVNRNAGAREELHSQDKTDVQEAELFLRPDDPMSKSIPSRGIATNNVLLRITVPKRIGRKRKRGFSEPCQDTSGDGSHGDDNTAPPGSPTHYGAATYLLRSLRDNLQRYEIRPVGIIERTHRFRSASCSRPNDAASNDLAVSTDSSQICPTSSTLRPTASS
jgi:hypothetical protein